ncbi:hypothetical protein Bsp3421_003495 [Burkholderia sp. FERM BP-3421]|jgi:hypothetical protein|uniref:hypothetical protein n=1 Tax=Burkholderia sp. FERM BP-3421 TaxID=1494466 RepID=UPI002360221A|nr:hypothetical protein [Burkholderia sp. FERM BP-3421]WDD93417.1 hypothetical protein Bsp3421_003495 [Burkholderia sp. FERM BP-3421]
MNARPIARRARAQTAPWLFLSSAALALALSGFAHAVHAQALPYVTGAASISPGAATNVTGVLTVNETAGLDNVQANQLVISGAGGAASATSEQLAYAVAHTGNATAGIAGNAFSNVSGVLMVNQSAGTANLQRNSAAVGVLGAGVETVSDTELSEAAPRSGNLGRPTGGQDMREVSISGDAFKHISGIVQVNQTAGAGNATANSFVLRPPAGTLF